MEQRDPNLLIFKEYPTALWLVSGVFSLFGLFFLFNAGGFLGGLIGLGVGLGMLLLGSVDTITLDKRRNRFSIARRYLWRTTFQEYPLDQVSGFELESSQSSDSGRTYRIIAVLAEAKPVPLTSAYTTGHERKRQRSAMLNQWLGRVGVAAPGEAGAWPSAAAEREASSGEAVAGSERIRRAAGESDAGTWQVGEENKASSAWSEADKADSPWRETTGIDNGAAPAGEESGETNGVRWQVAKLQAGEMPLRRWFSADFKFEDGFLLLAQKPQGMRIPGKLLGGLGRMFGMQALRVYGFAPEDSPGMETAAPLEPPEPRLEAHYVTLTSNQRSARLALNPWVIMPLVAWAERSPLQPARGSQDQAQAVILFSPNGVFVAGVGVDTAEEIEAQSRLGVELVRAAGG